MKGPFLLVLALASMVNTKPVSEEVNNGGSNLYLSNESDYYPCNEGDDIYGSGDYYNECWDYYNDILQDYNEDIQNNEMCSDFVKQITYFYRSSVGAQQSSLVSMMEEFRVYIQDKVAIAQGKHEVGEDFAYNSNDLKNLWESFSQSQGGPLRPLYKNTVEKYITTFGRNLNVFMSKEASARVELEEIISFGVDSLATYTQQKDWRNGEVSQLEEDAECFYDLMKSDLNYTIWDMTKEEFGNAARSVAHSLHVITASHGIKTSLTDIAMDAANKLKTVDYGVINNNLFEAIGIVSDEIVKTVEIQLGLWQLALGGPVPRLDDLILEAIQIVKSDNFWSTTEQLLWKTAKEYIEPDMLNMVDLVAELSNEVDIAYELDAVAATIEETIGSVNIDGQEIADAIEQFLFMSIENYLLDIKRFGPINLEALEVITDSNLLTFYQTFDQKWLTTSQSLMPLLEYGEENTKHDQEGTLADQEDISKDSISSDDNGPGELNELSTDGYEEIQEESGSIDDESVSKDRSVEFQEGRTSIPENNLSRESYVKIIEEDVSMIGEEQSADDNKEIVEDNMIIEEEDSSNGYEEIKEEDFSVISMEDTKNEIQAEED